MVTLSSYRYPRRTGDKQPDGVWSWCYLGNIDPHLSVASKPAADRATGGCLGSLGELSSPVVSAFALFPLVAIFYQFGWKQSLIAAVVVLMTRVVVVRYFPHLNPESIEIFIGMVMLLGIAITHDLRHRDENDIDASGMSVFEERTSRIIKNLPYIAIVGALIAAVASMKIFAGSEVSISHWRKRTPQA